jgi:hypothetical protein
LSTTLGVSAARTMAASVMFMLGSSDAFLEDQIGEGGQRRVIAQPVCRWS